MITLIAAMTRDRVIGKDGTLPFRCRADMRHFKRTTMGHPIIMGRKTYESIPKRPLEGRTNVVLSRSASEQKDGSHWFKDPEGALAFLDDEAEVFVIGGESVYEFFLPRANRLLLTTVDSDAEGDTYFPELGANWNLVESTPDEGCTFHTYERAT